MIPILVLPGSALAAAQTTGMQQTRFQTSMVAFAVENSFFRILLALIFTKYDNQNHQDDSTSSALFNNSRQSPCDLFDTTEFVCRI